MLQLFTQRRISILNKAFRIVDSRATSSEGIKNSRYTRVTLVLIIDIYYWEYKKVTDLTTGIQYNGYCRVTGPDKVVGDIIVTVI